MKKMFYPKTILWQLLLILIAFTSCRQYPQNDDLKFQTHQEKSIVIEYVEQENDKQFLLNAIEIDIKCIKLGQLVQQKSKKHEVKTLGRILEMTHSKSLKSLMVLARKKSYKIPTGLSSPTTEKYDKLSEQSKNILDLTLCNLIVISNEDALTSFEKASLELNDLEIFQCVMLILPALRASLNKSIICKQNVRKTFQANIVL